jgi:class 3 adenylate cyclase
MSDAVLPTDASSDPLDPLKAGREALDRRDWTGAFELLSRADAAGSLSGSDLEQLAVAAFFAARADEVLSLKERAFKSHLNAGDTEQAARVALDIAHEYGLRRRFSIASGWRRRGEKLLEGLPEGFVHGYLALLKSAEARSEGRTKDAIELAAEAARLAERYDHADLRGSALAALGTLRIASGEASNGLALLEEASIAAVNGELSPFNTGVICCTMIAACRDLAEYRRAAEWIEATDRYCERQAVSGFPGVCRIHRAEMTALAGAWEQAERELRQATAELVRYNADPPMADGYYALGEIRRLQGDFAGAEAALREAHALGRSPQPALALIRLAEGKAKAAAAAVNAAVAEETSDLWARARLLPAQAEISIAVGDVTRARAAADELAHIVPQTAAPALQATLHQTLGQVHAAEGNAQEAAHELRLAVRGWRDVASPYQVATARALLARVLRTVDDDEDADLELEAAGAEFERLGAKPDLAAAERELRVAAERRNGPVQVRKTFMFTDVVGSTRLAEALGDEAWEALLGWHDAPIRSVVGQGGGEVVNSTGDGFFVAFDSAGDAVASASAIQRALADHRKATGFSLPVRIGLHTAEANRRGDDYSGVAVHVTARVAALAGGGEIVATTDTLAAARDPPASNRRTAELKGVSGQTELATIAWDR